jgi:hypothetical protein
MTAPLLDMSAKTLVLEFGKRYHNKVGESYPPTWGRDIKLFSELLKTYEASRLLDLLDLYFLGFQRIYSIPFFKSALSDLIQLEKRDVKPKPIDDNESWRFDD